jgi:hypothetical protein
MKKVILINLLLLAAGLLVLELIFGSWFSQTSPLYSFIKPRNIQKTYKTPFLDQPEVAIYTIDKYGFRGRDKSLDEIFILTVGGSTTDQKYVDDAHTFEEILQKHFAAAGRDVDVVSAGIDGQSTFGHLKNFPYWFAKLPGFAPCYILYYVGVNDFFILRELPKFDVMEHEGAKARLRRVIHLAKEKSALYAAARVAESLISPPDVAHFRAGKPQRWSEDAWTTESHIANYRTPKVEKSLVQLRERITELARETRKAGARPIFVTQRSINWIERDGKIWGLKVPHPREFADALEGFGRMSGVDYHWLERLQAAAIMDACRASEGICIDLAGNMAIDHMADFYDPMHTTPSGSKRIGDFLYSRLKDLP